MDLRGKTLGASALNRKVIWQLSGKVRVGLNLALTAEIERTRRLRKAKEEQRMILSNWMMWGNVILL